MADVLREFLIAVGFVADTNSERKATAAAGRVEAAVRGSDDRMTQGQAIGSGKRILQANREAGVRTKGAAELIRDHGRIRDADEKRLAGETEAGRKRVDLSVAATSMVRGLASTAQIVASAVIGSAATIAAAGIGATKVIEGMAVGLERLYYSSQRTNTSAASLKAFGFAAGQLGSSSEEAIGAVETLAEKMRSSPGFEEQLKGLGVSTRTDKGALREGTDLMLQFGDALKKMPVFQQKAYANAYGMPETLLTALTSGKMRKDIEQYESMLGMAGLDPEKAKNKSKAFMDVWRTMSSAVEIVAIKVQSALVDKFGGSIEKFTSWLLTNSDKIADAIIKIGDTLGGWIDKIAGLFAAFDKLDPKTKGFLIQIGALVAALVLFSSGPLGALIAITAALVAFVDDETLKKLASMWEKFDALAKRLTGQDGLTLAFIALGSALALNVLAPLLKILPLLASIMGLSLPTWLLTMLGVGAVAHVANGVAKGGLPAGIDPVTGAGPGDEVGTGLIAPGSEGAGQRYIKNLIKPGAGDTRSFRERLLPKAMGGKDAPEAGGADAPRGDGSGAKGPARTGDMMRYAMDQLRREGVPEGNLRQAAAHLVGQATMESGLDPNKVHDGGTGYGIYGARDPKGWGNYKGARRSDMVRWLEANGYAKNSAEGQMREMTHRAMSGTYPRTRKILMGNGTGNVTSDTNAITGEFESPAVINHRAPAVQNADRVGPSASPATPVPPVAVVPKIEGALQNFNDRFKDSMGSADRLRAPTAPIIGGASSSNSTTFNNIKIDSPTSNTFSGVGDAKATASEISKTQTRVHADLLRNLQGAVA